MMRCQLVLNNCVGLNNNKHIIFDIFNFPSYRCVKYPPACTKGAKCIFDSSPSSGQAIVKNSLFLVKCTRIGSNQPSFRWKYLISYQEIREWVEITRHVFDRLRNSHFLCFNHFFHFLVGKHSTVVVTTIMPKIR